MTAGKTTGLIIYLPVGSKEKNQDLTNTRAKLFWFEKHWEEMFDEAIARKCKKTAKHFETFSLRERASY